MLLQVLLIGFVIVFIWALKRSRRRTLTAVYSLASMIVAVLILDRISRQVSGAYDHGMLAFIGIDVMVAIGAAVAYFHSSSTPISPDKVEAKE